MRYRIHLRLNSPHLLLPRAHPQGPGEYYPGVSKGAKGGQGIKPSGDSAGLEERCSRSLVPAPSPTLLLPPPQRFPRGSPRSLRWHRLLPRPACPVEVVGGSPRTFRDVSLRKERVDRYPHHGQRSLATPTGAAPGRKMKDQWEGVVGRPLEPTQLGRTIQLMTRIAAFVRFYFCLAQ